MSGSGDSPRRLLEEGADDFTRALLAAGRSAGPSAASRARALEALGLDAPPSPPPAARTGLRLLKWGRVVLALALAGGAAGLIGLLRHRAPSHVATTPIAAPPPAAIAPPE